MPRKPRKNQSEDSYMRNCVEELKKEGTPAAKAKEICYAAYKQNSGRARRRKTKKR